MPSVVNDSCVLCGACAEVCPVGAFHRGETQMVVDPNTCNQTKKDTCQHIIT